MSLEKLSSAKTPTSARKSADTAGLVCKISRPLRVFSVVFSKPTTSLQANCKIIVTLVLFLAGWHLNAMNASSQEIDNELNMQSQLTQLSQSSQSNKLSVLSKTSNRGKHQDIQYELDSHWLEGLEGINRQTESDSNWDTSFRIRACDFNHREILSKDPNIRQAGFCASRLPLWLINQALLC